MVSEGCVFQSLMSYPLWSKTIPIFIVTLKILKIISSCFTSPHYFYLGVHYLCHWDLSYLSVSHWLDWVRSLIVCAWWAKDHQSAVLSACCGGFCSLLGTKMPSTNWRLSRPSVICPRRIAPYKCSNYFPCHTGCHIFKGPSAIWWRLALPHSSTIACPSHPNHRPKSSQHIVSCIGTYPRDGHWLWSYRKLPRKKS